MGRAPSGIWASEPWGDKEYVGKREHVDNRLKEEFGKLPKHRGLSCFLLDMHSLGVTVKPIKNMLREYDISDVWLDNVKVLKSDMLGEKNKG